MRKVSINTIILGLIIAVGMAFRLVAIGNYPPSLNWDEVSLGYNAYSISTTLSDEWGIKTPIIFRAYGDYKLPVYVYVLAPLIQVFGTTELVVRLPSIMAGTLVIALTFWFASELVSKDVVGKKNKMIRHVALLAAAFVVFEPWTFFTSRVALEASLCLPFILGGVLFTLVGLRKASYHLAVGAILFGLSLWTYNSARVFVPLLVAALITIYRQEAKKIVSNQKLLFVSTACFMFFFVPMVIQLVSTSGQARYGEVEILDNGTISRIEEVQSTNKYGAITRLVYNKVTVFGWNFIGNYVSHLSPEFLFFKGGSDYQFSIPGFGVLYIAGLPFFITGLALALRSLRTSRASQVLVTWFLLAPIPASLTRGSGHVLRDIVAVPVPMILTALGAVFVLSWLKLKHRTTLFMPVVVMFVLAYATAIGAYMSVYFGNYAKHYSWAWQYGYKQLGQHILRDYSSYDKIIVTKKYGEPHEFLYFWLKIDPMKLQSDPNLIRFKQSNWFWVDGFDKFVFVNDWQIPNEGTMFVLESKKQVDCNLLTCLLVTSASSSPQGWHKVETIKFLDNTTAFELYSNN